MKKTVLWAGNSRTELAAIDRDTAMRILHAVDDYLTMALATLRSFGHRAATYDFFGNEKPARTTVGCGFAADIKVEIKCVAYKPK